ncbi:MAG: hypothetical protein M5U31_15305 [Acidimicrobiia bacterium]|nr:hypothetical protein [Acidimicrobiia bacterium]
MLGLFAQFHLGEQFGLAVERSFALVGDGPNVVESPTGRFDEHGDEERHDEAGDGEDEVGGTPSQYLPDDPADRDADADPDRPGKALDGEDPAPRDRWIEVRQERRRRRIVHAVGRAHREAGGEEHPEHHGRRGEYGQRRPHRHNDGESTGPSVVVGDVARGQNHDQPCERGGRRQYSTDCVGESEVVLEQ